MTIRPHLFAAVAMLPLATLAAPLAAHDLYSAEQFYQSTSYSLASGEGYAFSPDGRYVLVNSDASGVFNAYALPLDGGEPVMLTRSTDNPTFGASFFPADERLLLVADRGGNELNHLYVREADGSITDLTPGEKVRAQFGGWSADNATFYALTNERDAAVMDLYAYDADTYERRLAWQNPGDFYVSDASPDGRWLALSKEISSADSDIYLVDLASGGAPVLVTPTPGDIATSALDFTGDSSMLVYGTNQHGEFQQVWTRDLASGAEAQLIAADWDASASYSPSGTYRVETLNADASTQLTIREAASGEALALTGLPEGTIGSVRFSPDEEQIVFALTSDTSPTDIWTADLASGQARRLTSALNPAIDENDLVTATVARFASYDGVEVPGILYRPKTATADNPAPAVIYVHGGPGGQTRRGYNPTIQHLVNHGYAVYGINNRGSSGYGKTFFHMDDKRHGEADLDDVVAAKGFLQDMDWIADDRIAIMGGSYGGYMVAAALAFRPQVFDAGINIFGVTNWVRTLQSIPAWWGPQRVALYDELGDPETDLERLTAISPLFHADKIVKPMLVIQGANDPRVLQVESDELVEAVRANGVPVEYVLFPDEGHGFRGKQNRIDASEAYLAFLNEHIGS